MYIADEWLALERDVLGQRPLISGTVAEVRAAYAQTSEQLAGLYPSPSDYPVKDEKLVTDTGIAIRLYTPTNTNNRSENLPVGVFAHGGGNVNGGAWASSFEDRMCRYVAQHAGVIVAQVDFRLAPEFPAPQQLNDTFEAYKWLHANADKFHGDPSRFFAFGSSLGGGIAVGVALKLIDENLGHLVRGVVALCPALLHPEFVPDEFAPLFKAYEETVDAPLQNSESMMKFYNYNGGTAQRMNPYVFPALHPGLRRLPPVYQAVCEADPVRDDSTVLKHVLDKHGVSNKMDSYPGLPHYFWLWPQLKSSEKFHRNVAEGVKWVVSTMCDVNGTT
ncbi:alpha/beta-hydrolase [Westerdykella ornata]|uniref:Alpha/beta-hydrolase n=1 Tax=Westerdykella ornata TaxID=318751 RepID=A0A6A6JVK2_WESOR|nr:alpha/beta-hydrolase [Westerdykella ornata]KAF2280133.1 alpha/beta-hydrolase [Westerdykella ornata]